VLDAGAVQQYVIVQTTTGAVGALTAVAGATVTMILPNGRMIPADEIHDSTIVGVRSGEPRLKVLYRFALDKFGVSIVPGGSYSLRVALPDGRVATGNTTVPVAAPVLAAGPTSTFSISRDTLALAWGRVVGARSYELHIHSPKSDLSLFADTSIRVFGGVRDEDGNFAFVVGAIHQVVVSAVDSNYYDYYRRSSDPFTGIGVINRLTGAIGVFGSIVEISRQTLIVQ
jgi:hypothetical protein